MNIKIQSAGPIVMVDDDEIDFKTAKRFYEKSKLTNPFFHCEAGEEFLECLGQVKLGKKELPALVLMDINMPGLNGHETVREMRAQKEFSEVPVIMMLTSSVDPLDKEKAKTAGADEYFEKPTNPQNYIELFNSLL